MGDVNGEGSESQFAPQEPEYVDLSTFTHAAAVTIKASFVEPSPEGIALGLDPRIPTLIYTFIGPDGSTVGEFFLPLEPKLMAGWSNTHTSAVIAAIASCAAQG